MQINVIYMLLPNHAHLVCYIAEYVMQLPIVPKVTSLEPTDYTSDLWPSLQHASYTQGVLPCKGWGAMARQLDLPSMIPLSIWHQLPTFNVPRFIVNNFISLLH